MVLISHMQAHSCRQRGGFDKVTELLVLILILFEYVYMIYRVSAPYLLSGRVLWTECVEWIELQEGYQEGKVNSVYRKMGTVSLSRGRTQRITHE